MVVIKDMLDYIKCLSNIDDICEVKEVVESKLYNDESCIGIYQFTYKDKKFELFIPLNFPLILPKITLLENELHCHVDKKGVVCLPNQEDIFYDISDEELLIKKVINAVKKLYSMNEIESNFEIEMEYNDYLHYYTNFKNVECLLFESDGSSQLTRINNRILIGNKGKLLENYLKNKQHTVLNYKLLHLKTLPLIAEDILTVENIYSHLTETSKIELKKYHDTRLQQYYLLKYQLPNKISNYFMIVANYKDIKKQNALLDFNSNIEVMSVRNASMDFLRFRGGSKIFDHNILLLGCGSVGSEVAEMVVSSGFINITLIDNDIIKYENGFRNASGFWNLNNLNEIPKTKNLQSFLQYILPDVNCKTFEKDVISAIKSRLIKLDDFDYIICCTGNSIVDKYINDYLYIHNIKTKVIYAWLEPYGIAEHILTVNTDKKGCFECYLKSPNSIVLADTNIEYKIRNNVCCGSFTPYGRISTMKIATQVSEIILYDAENIKPIINKHFVFKRDLSMFLEKGYSKTKFMNFSQEEMDDKSRDFIYEGCNICGKCDY